MYTWSEYRKLRKEYFGESRLDSKRNYQRYKKASESMANYLNVEFNLAPLSTSTVPSVYDEPQYYYETTKGNKPMATRFNEVYANAVVTAQPSDTATQRDYLLSRLSNAAYPKHNELDKLFHRFVDNTPKTYKDLIDAIKSDKFTIDAKIAKRVDAAADAERDDDECNYNYRGPFYGIIWNGDQFDEKAWLAARHESEKQQRAAKDIIMTGDAAAGLAALQAFEAWLPTKETTPVQ